MKLTAKAVAGLQLPPGKTDVIYFDDEISGFGFRLRLGAGGKLLRSWIVPVSPRRCHPPPAARLRRSAQCRCGADHGQEGVGAGRQRRRPAGDKLDRRAKDSHTLKATVADFLAMKQREVRARTYTELARYLTGTYFKPLHSLALDQITRKDVASRLNRISLESSSIVAGRARAQLSALFSWALAHGLCEANPVVGTLAPKGSQPRERVLADAELAAIWKACGDDDHGRCIKLLILTGCRRAGDRRHGVVGI